MWLGRGSEEMFVFIGEVDNFLLQFGLSWVDQDTMLINRGVLWLVLISSILSYWFVYLLNLLFKYFRHGSYWDVFESALQDHLWRNCSLLTLITAMIDMLVEGASVELIVWTMRQQKRVSLGLLFDKHLLILKSFLSQKLQDFPYFCFNLF